jgi:NAD(P)H-dependent FMN reductase
MSVQCETPVAAGQSVASSPTLRRHPGLTTVTHTKPWLGRDIRGELPDPVGDRQRNQCVSVDTRRCTPTLHHPSHVIGPFRLLRTYNQTTKGNPMADLRIAVILGSTRPNRNGEAVADWVMEKAAGRTTADYELIDLRDHPLPALDEPVPPSLGQYAGEHTKSWADKVASYDGFIFVSPEYNHSIPGVLKNAIDYLFGEWNNKAAAFVSYGSAGGVRAIEHLRAVATELEMAHVRQQLSFSLFTDFENFSAFKPAAHHSASAEALFDQLESWGRAMKSIRVGATIGAGRAS